MLATSALGGALASRPGAGRSATIIGRGGGDRPVSRSNSPARDGSATIRPATSPPRQAGLARLGSAETPMSAGEAGAFGAGAAVGDEAGAAPPRRGLAAGRAASPSPPGRRPWRGGRAGSRRPAPPPAGRSAAAPGCAHIGRCSASFSSARRSCQMPSAIMVATAAATSERGDEREAHQPDTALRGRDADIRGRAAGPWRAGASRPPARPSAAARGGHAPRKAARRPARARRRGR